MEKKVSETPPPYLNTQPIYCPTCGILLGTETTTPNGTVLIIGNLEAQAFHGHCHNPHCQAAFHWVAGDLLPPFVRRRYVVD
jgi:hypothetical protein